MTSTERFYVQYRNKFLNGSDEFKAGTALGNQGAVFFLTETAALAKAESLSVDLDRVKIICIGVKDEAPSAQPPA